MTRRLYVAIVLFLLAPWGILLAVIYGGKFYEQFSKRQRTAPTDQFQRRVFQGKPGPWGQLEYTRIAVEPPTEFIRVEDAEKLPLRWVFPGYTTDKLRSLFQTAELSPDQVKALLAATRSEGDALVTVPKSDLVYGLTQNGRRTIYSVLSRSPQNVAQGSAFSFRPEFLDERIAGSGLAPTTVSLFKRFLYPHGNLLLFADLNIVVPLLPDRDEKVKFIKMVSRKTTLLVDLKVGPETDVNRLVDYWSFGGRAKDVRPLLDSLARVAGGCDIDIAHLLPQFARRRLYTYPAPDGDPLVQQRDSHWTSLNFFNAIPDDTFTDTRVALERIKNDYYTIVGDLRMGDLVLLALPDGRVFHSAVFLADDVVFTKNGGSIMQPWMLMQIDDLISYYSAFVPEETPLRLIFARRKAE